MELAGHGSRLKISPFPKSEGPGGKHKTRKGVKTLNGVMFSTWAICAEKGPGHRSCLPVRVSPRDGEFQSRDKPRSCFVSITSFQRLGTKAGEVK